MLGAPGSGKTAVVLELVRAAVVDDGLAADDVLVLTPSRRAATRLRDRLALELARAAEQRGEPAPALPGPLARSLPAWAFALVTAAHRLGGLPEPRLLSGADSDADLAELLDRSVVDELLASLGGQASAGPAWPEHLGPEVRRLPAFRTELRDVIARLSEHDWSTDRLRATGRERGRPEWVAVADFVDELRLILGSSRPGQLDPAELVRAAVGLVREPPEGMPPLPRLVIVDDAHDLTPSGADLLVALAERGSCVIALGDPDVATSGFRGGEPEALARLAGRLGRGSEAVAVLVLESVHRHGPAVRRLVSDVTGRIGAAAAGRQRRASSVFEHAGDTERPAPALEPVPTLEAVPVLEPALAFDPVPALEPVLALEAASAARERALIADVLRERHLLDGVPWHRMAIVVRSGTLVPPLVRALAQAEVPVQSTAAGRPLREHPAARALIRHVDLAVGRAPLDAAAATELLLGPLGGLDRVALRRLRRALRAEELAGGGDRSADELLVDALRAPGRLATLDHRVARTADRLARTLAAIAARFEAGATVDELLWIAWSESHAAELWQREAAGHGVPAREADRALDAVVAVFSAATAIVDTVPEATVDTFLARVLDSDVGDDLLAPQRSDDAVLVATPAALAGLEADVVVVAGLVEGVWPNLRVRGSLLGAPVLSRIARGLPLADLDERRLVLDDELRLFALAASRPRRQLIATAVAGDDEQPSALFGLVRQHAEEYADAQARTLDSGRGLGAGGADQASARSASTAASRLDASTTTRPVRARSLRRLVGRLRRELADPAAREADRAEAALALARLAAERVVGADPSEWWGLMPSSTDAPLFEGVEHVPLSPSKLEAIEKSPLDWFLDSIAPGESTPAMGIGTIVHWAMETAASADIDAVWQAIEQRWDELVFESPWLGDQQRRLARRYAVGVAAYLHDAAAEGRAAIAAERSFELDIDRARLRGIVDRIELDADGAVRIIDLKTGPPLTKQAEVDEHAQLGAYQLAYAEGAFDDALDAAIIEGARAVLGTEAAEAAAAAGELPGHRSGGARLLYVREGVRGRDYREAVQAPLDEEQLERFRQRVRQAVEAIAVARLTGVRSIDRFDFGAQAHRIHRVPPVTGEA